MGTLTASLPQNPTHEIDLEDLRQRQTGASAFGLMLVSALALLVSLPGGLIPDVGAQVAVWSVFMEAFTAFVLRTSHPRLSRAALLIGPALTLALTLTQVNLPAALVLATIVVMVNALIRPALGFGSALLNTVPILLFAPLDGLTIASLCSLWLAAGLGWVSSLAPQTFLDWAWKSQQEAIRLLGELRGRQEELNRTLAALTEASRRLQRTGHELAIARLRAEEARQLKEQFAANISHELRTPLNLIIGFSEMMYFSPEVYGDIKWPNTLRRDVRQIYQSSRQLLDLVDYVLDLARIDSAGMPVRRERSDLGEVLREAVSTIGDLVRGRDLELRLDLPETFPALNIDRTRIRQVLLNLLNNASRFTEQGSITVSAEVGESEVVVSVRDTGIGIHPEELTRVFDEFHQVDMSLRRRREGSGLGLAISKRFVELHDGRIWAESAVGQGSTFRFSLPLPGHEPSVGRLVAPRRVSARQTRDEEPSLVVVDRDQAVSAVIHRYLPEYRVLPADTVVEGGQLVDEWHPRALVINAPPEDDVHSDIARQALALVPPGVPVLVCSVPSQTWLASRTGVWDCLTKPVTRDQILDVLHELGDVRAVLVVDDDRGFTQMVSRFLQAATEGYRVRSAYDGFEALEEARAERPDAILLDLMMPRMDGFQFLEELHADPALCDVPIVAVTATSYGEDLVTRRGSAVAVHRQKGFSIAESLKYLRALLDLTEPDYAPHNVPAHQAVATE
jgi:signal transduction histidine kinase/CheY-like chemotaxis protein